MVPGRLDENDACNFYCYLSDLALCSFALGRVAGCCELLEKKFGLFDYNANKFRKSGEDMPERSTSP